VKDLDADCADDVANGLIFSWKVADGRNVTAVESMQNFQKMIWEDILFFNFFASFCFFHGTANV
jgi:hypothetical protein